jgi:hypothetical protein
MLDSLFSYSDSQSFVNRLRKNRFSKIESILNTLIDQKGRIRILDLGGDYAYWKTMNWKNDSTHITLLNLADTTIPLEQKEWFDSLQANALKCPFPDQSFDLVFSNSAIEHMGSIENQNEFANEVKRLAPNYIVQTPSIWFPLEPHCRIPFFQFIPHPIRAILLRLFPIHYFPKAKNYAEGLRSSKTTLMMGKKRFHAYFPQAEIVTEYLWGIPKSYTAIKLEFPQHEN